MANTILKAAQIVASGLGVLEREIVLPRLIASDANVYFSQRSPANDTVSLRIAGRTVARDYGWRNDRSTAIQVDDLNEFKVDVKLDTHIYNAIGLTDEELTLDIEDFTNQVLLPQTRAVAERLEGKIADKISDATYPAGSVIDIATSGGFYNSLVDGRKVLNDNNVPVAGRICLVGTGVEQVVLKDDQFKKFDQAGDQSALRDATIGRVAGFTVVTSNSIPEDEAYVFHPSAFQAVYRAPQVPRGVAFGEAQSYAGLAMRWIQDYDSDYLRDRSVLSTFFGISVVEDPDDYTDADSTKSLKRAVKLTLDATP
ncbi:hypothetical protein IM25_21370 [Rhodococcus sp. p52]|uniref:P22 phage major capsid protein family protein n=1 Tax=Rhodococcus sp. p52 TaxID=935199 RepID=UPI00051A6177|nr:P22 phage major capsid protein family protein [Rhodococcus sp. p52]AOD23815.1 hypothetical protein IM25_21370 [Rhodococcus sp. p52]